MGFGYEEVRKLNPKLVMCSVSTFGQSGPLANDPGYDFIGQAYAGVTWLSGREGEPHYPPMLAVGDVSTGVHALAAVACALLHRDRTGEGQFIDISLLDSYFNYHDWAVQQVSASGGSLKPARSGQHYPNLAPAGMFKARSGYIFIFAWLDHHWVKLCAIMGCAERAQDSRYASLAARVERRAETTSIIERWLASMPSDEAAVSALRTARIPSAPVLSVEEAMQHPHLRERRTVRTVHDRLLGEFQIPGFPLRFSAFPGELELEAPLLGEHNEQILSNYLGYSRDQIARLTRDGALHSAPR
jgi:crotonobetainyl-CoA:carnitine CoA-transferase CaiB-like acyl-CoA transferase